MLHAKMIELLKMHYECGSYNFRRMRMLKGENVGLRTVEKFDLPILIY